MPEMDKLDEELTQFCWYCAKSRREVKNLIAVVQGAIFPPWFPQPAICDECVSVAVEMIAVADAAKAARDDQET